ncbi:MAG: sugar transferase [Tropicimonas sp.]|uniref:sugar transferase n=1 Tax=Tropicimonas sp. TaxID=2067044 RepID=UPI003A85FFA8
MAKTTAAASNGLDCRNKDGMIRSYTGKRLLDLLAVIAALPFLSVLIAGLAALVALDGANPFFVQRRLGRDGRIFRMIKLRTMVPDAERRLEEYLAANPEAKREWEQFQKLSHDPRITRIGRLLRQTSLDELPQFLNVLFGHMSLVGPRPMMPDQAELYPGKAYYRMRPGITGPWQVSDRNSVSFAERARYDLSYFEAQSFLSDLRYIVLTMLTVCRMSGR